MAFHYSPKIVTDGLVFLLDAGNPKSYPGTGTAISDLSGNNTNGVLTNGPTFDNSNNGSIAFDGLDDFIEMGQIESTNPLSLYGIDNFSIDVWVNAKGTGDGYQRIIDKSSAGSATGGWGLFFGSTASTNAILFYVAGGAIISTTQTGITEFNKWVHYTITKNLTSFKLYKDGNLKVTTTSSRVIPSTLCGCRIGSWNHSTARELSGNVSMARVYHKTLTATEILQNYNATKTRFI